MCAAWCFGQYSSAQAQHCVGRVFVFSLSRSRLSSDNTVESVDISFLFTVYIAITDGEREEHLAILCVDVTSF